MRQSDELNENQKKYTKQICDFIRSKRSIAVASLEEECQLPACTISHAMTGNRQIPVKYLFHVMFILCEYGLKVDGFTCVRDEETGSLLMYKKLEDSGVIEEDGCFIYSTKEVRSIATCFLDLF